MNLLKLIDFVNQKIAMLCGWIIVVMTLTVSYDVMARYFFNSPTEWALELNLYLLISASFLAGGYCLSTDGHVRVDILYVLFPERFKALVDVITSVLFFILVIVLVWKGWNFAYEAFAEGKCSSEAMSWPLYPSRMMIPLGGFLIGIQGVAKLIRDLYVLFKGDSVNHNVAG